MRIVEKEGRTKEEALKEALKELNAKIDDVKIEYLDEGKTGFLGLGKTRPAKVRVYLLSEKSKGYLDLTDFIKNLCLKMGVKCEVSVASETEDQIIINISSPDSAFLIGHRGKTIESLQYIINVIYNNTNKLKKKIIIDIGNYREKRRVSLERLAMNIAERVRKTRKPYILEEMNPYERRIIHVVLEKEKDIETVSLGKDKSGKKKIKIFLK